MDRIRSWLPFESEQRRLEQVKAEAEGKPKKRKPFKKKIELPWYSLNRNRNLIILAIAGSSLAFWDALVCIKRIAVFNYRFLRERQKYLKELDEEDRVLEKHLAAGKVPPEYMTTK